MKITKDIIIGKIKEIASQKGLSSLSKTIFISESGITEYECLKHFNSWNDAIVSAGLDAQGFAKPYEADALFLNLKEVFEKSEGLCSRTKFNKVSSISHDTYRRHFGTWQDALVNFKKWLEDNKFDYNWITELPDNLTTEFEDHENISAETDFKKQWNASTGNRYGSFLNFRGLQHAPINEQGVVFLFGMICLELGFIVEAVQTGFPDCEAKRRIDNKKDHWERVRIEFEYRSSNFREHGHNPTKCDLIVCWEHNWKDCPIEVIELKKVLLELEN